MLSSLGKPRYLAISSDSSDLISNRTSISTSGQKSGGNLPVMYVALADPYGQIVGTESNKKIDISLKASLTKSVDATKYAAGITGTTTFYS